MRKLSYRDAIKDALREEMRRDERVFLLGEDIAEFGGSYKVTEGLLAEFGAARVRNTPISEAAIVGAALGAALMGLRPVAEIMYIDFMGLAMDQLVNQAAKVKYMFGGKARVPMVVRTQGGGGRSSGAQHAQSLEAWFVHVPGLKVVMPSTPADARGLLLSAIRDDNPVVFIEHKLLYPVEGEVPDGDGAIPLGLADVKRPGRDVTIVATSRMVHVALAAADRLATDGIEAEVVDPRTLAPLDEATILASVRRTHRLVVAQEAVARCSVASEIAAVVTEQAFDDLDAPITRVAALPAPLPFAPALEQHVLPGEDRIVAAVRGLL
jgi:pyruvate/2-oxoglutarate/acetoin dehydrogenase E1 component